MSLKKEGGEDMRKKLIMSIASLVAVLAIGGGATYALLTTNNTTIANNSVTSASATLKLCNNNGSGTDNQWSNSITGFSTTGLIPGTEKELTLGADVFAGNDNAALNAAIPTKCTAYHDASGLSDVNVQLVPQVANVTCELGITAGDVQLRFVLGGHDSGYSTLTAWETNTATESASIAPNATASVKMFVKLDSSFTAQHKNCHFDATFKGQQS